MANKPKRQVFHSVYSKKDGWTVKKNKQIVSHHETQKASEAAAVKAGRGAHASGGLGQAVLHKKVGSGIREERTYGKDPEKTKG